jgi:hypothetical protein
MKRAAAFQFAPSTRPRRGDESAPAPPPAEAPPPSGKRPRPAEGGGGAAPSAAAAAAATATPDFPAVGPSPAEELALASGPLKVLAAAVFARHEAAAAAALRGSSLRPVLEEALRGAARAALEAAEEGPEAVLGSPEKVRNPRLRRLPIPSPARAPP